MKRIVQGKIETAEEHKPDYLRLSQAERERLEQEKSGNNSKKETSESKHL